eukprot:scaffold275467_cov17-Tisochrysis_lutea.AAC.1
MQRLQLGCTLIEGLIVHGLCAADQVAAQVARSFFMPLGLTSLAMLARIQKKRWWAAALSAQSTPFEALLHLIVTAMHMWQSCCPATVFVRMNVAASEECQDCHEGGWAMHKC